MATKGPKSEPIKRGELQWAKTDRSLSELVICKFSFKRILYMSLYYNLEININTVFEYRSMDFTLGKEAIW